MQSQLVNFFYESSAIRGQIHIVARITRIGAFSLCFLAYHEYEIKPNSYDIFNAAFSYYFGMNIGNNILVVTAEYYNAERIFVYVVFL